jgi:hypothetical protein
MVCAKPAFPAKMDINKKYGDFLTRIAPSAAHLSGIAAMVGWASRLRATGLDH